MEILLSASQSETRCPDAPTIIVVNQTANEGAPRPTSPTFGEFVRTSFEPSYLANMRPGGRNQYAYMLKRHILPELADKRLSDISFDQIQELVQKALAAGYAVQSARHIRGVIHCVFRHALHSGQFAGALPSAGIRLPALVRVRERRALTVAQAGAVLKELKSPYREMALVSMTTSMNLAELCALKWQCVNVTAEPVLWDGQVIPPDSIFIHQSFYAGSFGPPKTPRRRRLVPLPKAVADALRRLKETTRFGGPGELVFSSRNGTPKLASNLRYAVIKPVGRRLGMPWLNWHAFRYTYSTIGEQLNISLSDRQAGMGHASVWMTQEYTVGDIERLRAGAEMIARKIA